MPILANSIWVGAMPYSFRYWGLHVIFELAIEIWIIWIFLEPFRPMSDLRWISLWVVMANIASFGAGTLILTAFSVPKTIVEKAAAAWIGAFAISWLIESAIVRLRLKAARWRPVLRACFWGNVASYLIAALLFIAYLNGVRIPWIIGR